MDVAVGTVIKGSWNNNTYHLLEKIGEGSFGQVFLAKSTYGDQLAIKLSRYPVSITKEYRLLTMLSQNQRIKKLNAIPGIIDSDDWTGKENLYRFIALEYFEGQLLSTLPETGRLLPEDELVKIGISLGWILDCLHEQQLILGDLKPANLIYQKGIGIKLVDFGGVTKQGQLVEEYTPFFDRASWKMGDRLADPSYDIFSLCMLLIILGSGSLGMQLEEGAAGLQKKLTDLVWTDSLKDVLWSGLAGQFKNIKPLLRRMKQTKFTDNGRKQNH
jgi:serine/threonine-protein kinase